MSKISDFQMHCYGRCGDETRIYAYDPETVDKSGEYRAKLEVRPKKNTSKQVENHTDVDPFYSIIMNVMTSWAKRPELWFLPLLIFASHTLVIREIRPKCWLCNHLIQHRLTSGYSWKSRSRFGDMVLTVLKRCRSDWRMFWRSFLNKSLERNNCIQRK